MIIRDPMMDPAFFNKWVAWLETDISDSRHYVSTRVFDNPRYRAQYVFTIFRNQYELLIMRYSRGDDIEGLRTRLAEVVRTWEWAYIEEMEAFAADEMDRRKNFEKSFDYYVVCLWLLSLAYCLEVDEDLMERIFAVIGNQGNDALFDRLAAVRLPGRRTGQRLLYPGAYQLLYDAMDAPARKAAKLVADFLRAWYSRMAPAYWHDCHTGPEGGGYFGYWCFEATGMVRALGLDDRSFRHLQHYPADLAGWNV